MKYDIFLSLLIGCLIFTTCTDDEPLSSLIPSNNISLRTFSFTDFENLTVDAPMNVFITFSSTEEKVEIEANENLHAIISIEEINGELKIAMTDQFVSNGQEVLTLRISTPAIVEFKGSGEAQFILQNTLSEYDRPVSVVLSGEAGFAGDLVIDQLNVELNGEAEMNVSGTTQQLIAKTNGDSFFQNFLFTTDQLNANLTGESKIDLTVNENITVAAQGESVLRYKGEAEITSQNISAEAQVIKVD